MNNKKQIGFGAIISYGALIVNIIITLFYTPWMVSKIGKAAYGLYTLAISLIGMLMLDFGLGVTATRYLAKYKASNDDEKISEFLGAIFKLYIIIDIIITIILAVVYVFLGKIYRALTAEELVQFRILFIIVAVFNVLSFPTTPINGIFNANEQFVLLKICDLLNKLLSVTLVVIFLYFGYGVVELVLGNTISGIVTIFIKFCIAKKKMGVKICWKTKSKGIYKEIFSFSIWTTINSLAGRLSHNIAPSILAIVCGSVAVSIYSPASSLGSYYYNIAIAINGLFLPRISRLVSDNKENEIINLMLKVGRYQTFVLGLILSGFVCIGDIFISLWMGADFYSSYYCAILLMIPAFFEYSQQIANTTIIVKNKVKEQAILLVCTSVISVGLSFLFSYLWGEVGMCVAICLIGLINVAGLNVIHYTKLNIPIQIFYRECYGKICIPLVLVTIIGRLFSMCVGGSNIIWLLIKGASFIVLYCVAMWIFALNKEEKTLCKGMLKRLTKR